MVISHALAHGRKAAAATVLGVVLGDGTAMTASLAGLGALLAVSPALFVALRWAGAIYLVALGLRLWRAPANAIDSTDAVPPRSRALVFHAFAVTALNPKTLVFFLAFVPQFLDRSAPVVPQFAIFEATFLTLAAMNAAFYALSAAAARSALGQARVRRNLNRAGGSLLIGAGMLAAAMR
jgi:threonine/homoserine/homoserine lactone efflux protein